MKYVTDFYIYNIILLSIFMSKLVYCCYALFHDMRRFIYFDLFSQFTVTLYLSLVLPTQECTAL